MSIKRIQAAVQPAPAPMAGLSTAAQILQRIKNRQSGSAAAPPSRYPDVPVGKWLLVRTDTLTAIGFSTQINPMPGVVRLAPAFRKGRIGYDWEDSTNISYVSEYREFDTEAEARDMADAISGAFTMCLLGEQMKVVFAKAIDQGFLGEDTNSLNLNRALVKFSEKCGDDLYDLIAMVKMFTDD